MKSSPFVWVCIACAAMGGALLTFGGKRDTAPAPPVRPAADVVIRSGDQPSTATIKGNVLYLQAQEKMFTELAAKAGEFPDSGSAADWMTSQSEQGHTEAFRGWHGYLFGFFGAGKKYDPADVKRWATDMAKGCRSAIDALQPLVQE